MDQKMENFRRCRICISESTVMMSIFGADALWRKLSYFANVDIEEGDSLPQQICVMCAKNAINAFAFKQKCVAADKFYRKQLREKPDDVISVSSGDGLEEQPEEKCDKYRLGFWNFIKANFPIVVEDSSKPPSECNNDEWAGNQNAEQEDNEHLPLIPEIELITPNDEDKKTANGYQCSICFEFFAMKSILKHHVKIKHPEANPTYECFECKKTYLSKRFLDKHIRRGRCVKKRKNQSRVMQCVDCHESFPSGHHLGWHKRSGTCPSPNKQVARNNATPAPVGPVDSDSKDEQIEDNSKAEKDLSRKVKRNRRKKWTHKKRKRTRLDSAQIELAKQLILWDATTARIAQELNISRTFAWKLRKNQDLLNISNSSEDNHPPNGEQQEINDAQSNDRAKLQPEALNLSKKVGAQKPQPQPQNYDHSKGLGKPQENGQLNSRPEAGSGDEVESSRRIEGIDDGEETESADESHVMENSSRPSFSQNSLPTPIAALANNAAVLSPANNDNTSVDNEVTKPSGNNETPKTSLRKETMESSVSNEAVESSVNNEDDKASVNNDAAKAGTAPPPYKRRPRKPNVFMTPEKYEEAKQLVAHRATTMEVAKHLNISQMSAWKLRDNILKGIPLTFRTPPAPRQREPTPKLNIPRQRLKGVQRRERNKQITEEILTMLREDNTIQYWKVSEKLAEKGLHLSASSVCQRLKSMGIHRRWKATDPRRLDTEEGEEEEEEHENSAESTDSEGEDDNSSSVCGTTDTSQFLSTSFAT